MKKSQKLGFYFFDDSRTGKRERLLRFLHASKMIILTIKLRH